jgi:hypothetical protein
MENSAPKGLIIKRPWLDKIFALDKTWEMRSRKTTIRGHIKLIESGSGMIVGECLITGCHPITKQEMVDSWDKHRVDDVDLLLKWSWAWHLGKARQYDTPIPYTHPQGAVIWVNL